MGKGERSRAETQAHNISSRQKENCCRSAGEVGEGEGAAAEDFLGPDMVLAVDLASAVSQRCKSGMARIRLSLPDFTQVLPIFFPPHEP